MLEPGESTTVRLIAHFPDTDYAFAGVFMNLLADGGVGEPRDLWSHMDFPPPFDGPGTPPSLSEEGIMRIIAGQLNFPPLMIYADPTNPIPFFEVTFTAPLDAGGGYRVDLMTEVLRFDVYPHRDRALSESRLDLLVEDSASIFVVPSPASATVVLLGLAAMGRRR